MTGIQFSFFLLMLLVIIICAWNSLKIREVHLSTNSRLDQLLASSIGEAHAAGVKEERDSERLRQSVKDRDDAAFRDADKDGTE